MVLVLTLIDSFAAVCADTFVTAFRYVIRRFTCAAIQSTKQKAANGCPHFRYAFTLRMLCDALCRPAVYLLQSPLIQRPSVNGQRTPSQAKPKLHLENRYSRTHLYAVEVRQSFEMSVCSRQMQDILQTMPHNDLMEMKVSLEEEISQIETELGYTLKSEFTLIQSPAPR